MGLGRGDWMEGDVEKLVGGISKEVGRWVVFRAKSDRHGEVTRWAGHVAESWMDLGLVWKLELY